MRKNSGESLYNGQLLNFLFSLKTSNCFMTEYHNKTHFTKAFRHGRCRHLLFGCCKCNTQTTKILKEKNVRGGDELH